jgi:hypothetical protein
MLLLLLLLLLLRRAACIGATLSVCACLNRLAAQAVDVSALDFTAK